MNRFASWFRGHLDSALGMRGKRRKAKGAAQRARRSPLRRLMLEQLEERTLLSGSPTISWDGGGGDYSWINPLNWTEDRLPNATDDVEVRVPGQHVTIVLETTGGAGTAVRSLCSEENLDITGGLALAGASEITGALTVRDSSVTVQAGADLVLWGGATFVNPAALNVTAGAAVHFAYGTYDLRGSGVNAGTIDIAPDATVLLNGGGLRFDAGASATGTGILRIQNAGGINVAGNATVQNIELTSGGLGGAGTLTVTDTFTWTGGILSGSGSTDIAPGALLNIGGSSDKNLYGYTLNNRGTAVWSGSGAITGYGSVVNNLAGATFTALGGQFVHYLGLPADMTFNNAGTFVKAGGPGETRIWYAQFTNTGTVEVESGTLGLGWQSTSNGSFSVAAGARLEFRDGTHTLSAGSSVSGPGAVRFGTGSPFFGFGVAALVYVNGDYDVGVTDIISAGVAFNAQARTNIAVLGHGSLEGTGTLETTGVFEWAGGSMMGSGATTIAPSGLLIIVGDNEKFLDGRRLNSYGQVTWTGPGSVMRRLLPGGNTETFVNANIRPQVSPAFDACADAAGLFRAMFGGVTGWGTTKEAIYRMLEGKTATQITAIRRAYQEHYYPDYDPLTGAPHPLDTDVETEFSGDELTRVQKLLAGDRAGADAAALYYAMHGGVSGVLGADRQTIFKVLEGSVDRLADLKQSYTSLYNPDEPELLKKDLEAELAGSDEERALALLEGNRALADAIRLHAYSPSLNSAPEEINAVLGGRTPQQIADLVREFQARYSPENPNALRDYIQDHFFGSDQDLALALLEGDLAKADAVRLRAAMNVPGTDERAVWQVLENKTSEKRAAIAQAYRQLYSVELISDIESEFSDTTLYGPELTRTRTLLYKGGLSDAERLFYAIQGVTTDEDTIRQVLANRTLAEIEQIRMEYLALSGGESLDDALRGDLGGRDWFRAQQDLLGRPEGIGEEFARLNAYYAFERTASGTGFGSFFMDAFTSHGTRLDGAVDRAGVAVAEAFDSPSADTYERARRLICYGMGDVQTYADAKDSAAETFGTVVSAVAGMAVVWASAGTGAPLALALVALKAAGAGAAGQVIGQVLVSGQSYDVERLPAHIVTGLINGGTAALTFGTGPITGGTLSRVLQGAREGILVGGTGSFIGGVAGAMLRDGAWDEGVWRGLVHAASAGALSGFVGALTGGVLGALLRAFSPNCFPAGTLVSTEEGLRPIETILANERVWAYDFRSAEWRLCEVAKPLSHDYNGDLIRISVADEEIDATGNHPFWVTGGEQLQDRPRPEHVPSFEPRNQTTPGRWVDARDLRIGDLLLLRDGSTPRVTRLCHRTENLKVYNLQVAELHTFAVGKCQILVHNRFENQLEHLLDQELAAARPLGVRPIRVTDPGFENLVNSGRIKWAVMEDGELFLIPHTVGDTEIAHTVITGGRAVLCAGEADIAAAEGHLIGIEITNHSGHYQPLIESLTIGRQAFARHGIAFPD